MDDDLESENLFAGMMPGEDPPANESERAEGGGMDSPVLFSSPGGEEADDEEMSALLREVSEGLDTPLFEGETEIIDVDAQQTEPLPVADVARERGFAAHMSAGEETVPNLELPRAVDDTVGIAAESRPIQIEPARQACQVLADDVALGGGDEGGGSPPVSLHSLSKSPSEGSSEGNEQSQSQSPPAVKVNGIKSFFEQKIQSQNKDLAAREKATRERAKKEREARPSMTGSPSTSPHATPELGPAVPPAVPPFED